jgi:hypothetical protein
LAKSRGSVPDQVIINKEQFEIMMAKLDALIKVTAASLFRGKDLKDGIGLLTSIGYSSKEVAEILGTTDGYVRNVNYLANKEDKKKAIEENGDTAIPTAKK